MRAEIKVPAVGESVTEATVAEWVKKTGDHVQRDDVLAVLETDKASVEIVAEHSGVLTTKVKEGDTVTIGTVLGEINTEASSNASPSMAQNSTVTTETSHTTPPPSPQSQPHATASSTSNPNNTITASAPTSSTSTPSPSTPPTPSSSITATMTDTNISSEALMSPSATKYSLQMNITPPSQGSGRGGRVIKEDLLKLSNSNLSRSSSTSTSSPSPSSPPPQSSSFKGEQSRKPMSRLRQTIARRLVESQHTAAILTTFNEIDMSQVIELRKKYKEAFKKKYQVNLGFMGFFVKAVIQALKDFPKVNAFIDGKDIVYNHYYNIGIAVGTERGLVVPVVSGADTLSLFEIEAQIKDFALRARDGKITMDDLSGGTFTISNGGTYGSMMSTPILNPPQSGILGLHKIEKRPVVVDEEIVIRPMMYVALSYDHRLIDGSESVRFLVRIKEVIEDPSRILLEI